MILFLYLFLIVEFHFSDQSSTPERRIELGLFWIFSPAPRGRGRGEEGVHLSQISFYCWDLFE